MRRGWWGLGRLPTLHRIDEDGRSLCGKVEATLPIWKKEGTNVLRGRPKCKVCRFLERKEK